jgi:hypothetical protein
MTAYTALSNALVDVGAKPFATTIQALRDNPIAIAEGSPLSPVNSTGWHPYDMVNVDDGATGLYYDVAVSGVIASIVSPTFEAGYDYWIVGEEMSHNSGGASLRINGTTVSASQNATVLGRFDMEISAPARLNFQKMGLVQYAHPASAFVTGLNALSGTAATPLLGYFVFSNFATALTSVTLDWTAGSWDQGKLYLFRRRNFMP